MAGAFETGKYRNVFAEYGYPEAEIQRTSNPVPSGREEWSRHLRQFFMGMRRSVSIMRWEPTWHT